MIKTVHQFLNLAIVLISGLLMAGAAAAQVVVVTSAKSSIAKLEVEQISNLYLGKINRLPSGGNAVLLDLPPGDKARDQFYSEVIGRTADQVRSTWARLMFSGKGNPPQEKANATDVKKFLAANPDTIGYIDKSAVDPSVKVIFATQ